MKWSISDKLWTCAALIVIAAFLLGASRSDSMPIVDQQGPLPQVTVLFECYQPVYYIVSFNNGSPFLTVPATLVLKDPQVAKIIGEAMVEIESAGYEPEIRYMDVELGRKCA